MLPANTMGAGQHVSPVIIATPVGVPTPAVNMGIHAMAVPFCPTILFTCQPALNMASIVPLGPNLPPLVPPVLPSANIVGIPTVLLMGIPATAMTMPTMAGGPPGITGIPDVTTVLLAYAAAIGEAPESVHPAMAVDDARAIARSLAGPTVESRLLAGGVGLVSVRCFSSRVATSLFHAVETLTRRGMESLLIDLRGNPGGEVDAAIRLAGDFLEPDALIATVTDMDGDAIELRAHHSKPYAFPVALLVDGRTASAAELFAGSLKAHGRAVIVGQRTYGKGVAQAAVASAEGALYGTAATFTLPGGESVQGTGVSPDLPWPSTDVDAWRVEADRYLPAGLRDAIVALGSRRSGPSA